MPDEAVNLSSVADLKNPRGLESCVGQFLACVKSSIGRVGVKLEHMINHQGLTKGKPLKLRLTGEDFKLAKSFSSLTTILANATKKAQQAASSPCRA